ncbi:alpha/beta fold hydrolase [Brucella haematophila]|uniref:Alpha/beta hydrolase n=1 Tax=Brucella haematophila TaxID=419474 RepID=A0ABX1DPT0_9HYPH|nr:alpha/beta hydrolase [Brucella haematophila]NKC04950.1 alpha/beta hydrolase [Brucella haematophila]TMV04523.1 alpha/beta hydrolase [Brucella haematophila]
MSAGQRLEGTPEPHGYIETRDGLSIAYDRYGDVNSPALVLLHGGGQMRASWDGIARKLVDAGFSVTTFDARGHGDSDWCPIGDYGQLKLTIDLETILSKLHIRKPILVGASMGGMTGIVAAGAGLEVAGLVLLDVAPMTEEKGFNRIRSFMSSAPDGYENLEAVALAVAHYRGEPPRQPGRGLVRSLRQTPDGRLRWHWDPRLLASRTAELEGRRSRLSDALARIERPVLLLRGEHSDFLSEEGARDFLNIARNGRYICIKGAGHMVQGEDNDPFITEILNFARALRDDARLASAPS